MIIATYNLQPLCYPPRHQMLLQANPLSSTRTEASISQKQEEAPHTHLLTRLLLALQHCALHSYIFELL